MPRIKTLERKPHHMQRTFKLIVNIPMETISGRKGWHSAITGKKFPIDKRDFEKRLIEALGIQADDIKLFEIAD